MEKQEFNYLDQVRQLLDAGLPEDAKIIEEKVRKLNPHLWIGSAFTEEWLNKFITVDPDMLKLKASIRILAAHDDPVLIYGETGTGKELLANALHASRQGKFETINCAAIPELLLESILFGHKKGSFTDADNNNPGLMRTCWNGTLFMDEVGEMPPLMQTKLLRAIQNHKIRAVGDNKEETINCRFVFATNQNLKELIENKLFRKDLFYRISVFELETKPLWARKEDIALIAKSLWPEMPADFPVSLEAKPLRGNVRELQNIIRRIQVGI
jgi:transcriptional regulator with PAS, ATPase and Fis domain